MYMKMVKKMPAILLVFVLLFIFAACGSPADSVEVVTSSPSSSDESSPSPSVEITQSETVQETEAPTNQILYEDNDIKIEFTSMSEDLLGPMIGVYIENNSDHDITAQVRDFSVNGIMINTIFSSDVASGKKTNDSISIMGPDLEDNDITAISTIELSFIIYDAATLDKIAESDPVTINFGDSSAEQSSDASTEPAGEILYEGDGITVTYKSIAYDGMWGPEINILIENDSDQNITVQARDCSINGFMVEPIFSSEVVAGKKANDSITFMSQDLEENDITEIETIDLSLHIFDTDSWDTIMDTDFISITVE
jgi:hypothetical protein